MDELFAPFIMEFLGFRLMLRIEFPRHKKDSIHDLKGRDRSGRQKMDLYPKPPLLTRNTGENSTCANTKIQHWNNKKELLILSATPDIYTRMASDSNPTARTDDSPAPYPYPLAEPKPK